MSISEEYDELIALTKAYLQEENSTWLPADPESYAYFKSYALQKKPVKEPTPAPTPALRVAPRPLPAPPIPAYKSVPEIKKVEPVAVKEEIKETEEPVKQAFELNPLKPNPLHDLSDVKKTIQALWPHLNLLEKPEKREPEILLVFKAKEEKESAFLANVTKALQRIAPTKMMPLHQFQTKAPYPKLKIVILVNGCHVVKEESLRYFEMPPFPECLKTKKDLWKALKNACLY